jgi:hypothetical protein
MEEIYIDITDVGTWKLNVTSEKEQVQKFVTMLH